MSHKYIFAVYGSLLAILFSSCMTAPQPVADSEWARVPGSDLAARILSHRELVARFGQGAENNPFISEGGVIIGGQFFTPVEICNEGKGEVAVEEVLWFEDSGEAAPGKAFDAKALVAYWAPIKKYADTLEEKKRAIRASCISWDKAIAPSERRLIILVSKRPLEDGTTFRMTLVDNTGLNPMFVLVTKK